MAPSTRNGWTILGGLDYSWGRENRDILLFRALSGRRSMHTGLINCFR
jgi:hypothetical protein